MDSSYGYTTIDIKGNLVPIDFTKEKYVEYIKNTTINNNTPTIFQQLQTLKLQINK